MVLKDQSNKAAHEGSAQIACEGAGAIRTVASLKREDGFYQEYSDSLEFPLRKALRSAWVGGSLFGMTQSVVFFGAALVSMPPPKIHIPERLSQVILVWFASGGQPLV